MSFTPRTMGIDVNQVNSPHAIRTGVYSARAAYTEVDRDDSKDSATADRQAGSGKERAHPVYSFKIKAV